MSQPLFVKNVVTINAPAATVWDALVNPVQTKKYMFGCETVSDWQPGSSLEWIGEYEGKAMVFVKGILWRSTPANSCLIPPLIPILASTILPKTT
ncbi:SRPBCC domain-containing protein [Paraflavitalea speifideaquila]|uniref:SRPBCC domain-containing protein n=1 Tax=Paraflavitalea speifideaquila TaxID=3076558 RepID=UPI003312FDEC